MQGGQSIKRPLDSLGPGDHGSKVPEGIATLKPSSDRFGSITDSRKRKADLEVYNAFIGHPEKCDPSHVKLMVTGWAMAKRVFHLPKVNRWPSSEANAFMKKYLTLVPEQKMESESNLTQKAILKDFEKNPSFKQAFKFKTKMFASMKSQRTFLVPLFKFLDQVT